MSSLRLFLPIGKVDEAQRLVYGTLTAETPDKSGEIFDYASGKPAVQAWSDEIFAASKGKSLGNVRAMHDSIAAGKFTDIVYDDDNKRIEGAAKIVDDAEWEKVLSGVYTGFSIGGSYTKRWKDKENPSLWRFTPSISEISLVDNPCVGVATFEYVKADGSIEMRKFHTHTNEDSMDPILLKAAQEADAAGTATDEQKALLAKAAEGTQAVLVKDGKPVKPSIEPEQVWKASDGTTFATKAECRVHNLQLEKQAELAPGLDQMDALLKGTKKPADDEDEDKDGDSDEEKEAKKARRDKKAADQAKKDDDAAMAAKAAETAELAKATAEAAALAAAKPKPAPIAKTAPAAPLKKGLHQIGWMANLLSELQCLQGSVEFEQMWEQDAASELPAKFKSLVSEMCQVLVALVNEETEELIEGDDTDVVVLEMAAGLPEGHPDAIAKFARAKAEPLVKSDSKTESATGAKLIALADSLEKAGARHSKADADRVQALHDTAADMHKCMGDMVEKCAGMMKAAGESKNTAIDLGAKGDRIDDEDDQEPANKAASIKMTKLYEQLSSKTDEVLAVSKVAAASNETLLKAIPLIEGLQGTVSQLEQDKLDLAKRLKHLEEQPAPAKGFTKAVSKTQDSGTGDGNVSPEKVSADLSKLAPGQRVHVLMKDALSNPMPVLG